MGKKTFGIILVLFLSVLVSAQFRTIEHNTNLQKALTNYAQPPFKGIGDDWVDSTFIGMTLEEKIGQLFMVAAYSNKDEAHYKQIDELVAKHHIGGLIFFQGGPGRQAILTNRYQQKSKLPLMIAMDAEWGLSMRLDSTISYPKQMTLGAIQNNQLIYKMGQDLAMQCRALGVHVNFAPVIDVNSNANNPVINYRSFGENKESVAAKGVAYMRGMQDNNVLAVGKHFPGHGDTDTDSHKELPVINHPKKLIFERELFPFQELIQKGVGGMMVAHLYIPAFDNTPNLASTLSPKVVQEVLKDSLKFEGLIFTDALNMKGVSKYHKSGDLELKALKAGNDVLLFSENVPLSIQKIKSEILNGNLDSNLVNAACKKILQTKFWLGLNKKTNPLNPATIYSQLNKSAYQLTNRQLYENSITLLRNEDNLIPVKKLEQTKIALLNIGDAKNNSFATFCKKYAAIDVFSVSNNPDENTYKQLFDQLAKYDLVIVGVFGLNQSAARKFGITPFISSFTSGLTITHKTIIAYFGNPYGLDFLPGLENSRGLIVSYESNKMAQELTAQAIFGGVKINGKLPVSSRGAFKFGDGLEVADAIRLKYTIPTELNLRDSDLAKIDSIALNGINAQAYPGCQVLIAKDGKVFYNKSFGKFTYEEKLAVNDTSIYDLASITKMAASLTSFMKLYEENKVNLDYTLCDYLPERVAETAYEDLVIREVLAHQARLPAWIPFFKRTLVNGYPKYQYYSAAPSAEYPLKVAEGLYIRRNFVDSVFADITATPLRKSKEYLYSDLGFYFLKEIIEKTSKTRLDSFANKSFYAPLGMNNTSFLPKNKFNLEQIVPTEYDMQFRRQLVHGHVHDPGAAMIGGVGGHAGLFSNANDLAKLMQMLVNGGEYGGERYLSNHTIQEFTKCQFCEDKNRRGAGFDKPTLDNESGPTCNCVSLESFGHTGFTGTIAWADPEKKVVYIFLSNRIYPSAANKKLISMGIRTEIMQAVYDAIENAEDLALTDSLP